jgi:farnesyl-diphosphate farnesyltransferase
LFPKQDPKKLAQEAAEKQKKEPAMTTSETLIMIAVVVSILLAMTGLMVSNALQFLFSSSYTTFLGSNNEQIGIAWFFGARFDGTLSDTAKLWSGSDSAPSITGHDEL